MTSNDMDVKPGPSGCSTPAVTLQQEPDPYSEECPLKATGTKRILGTVDPDYAHPPDSKRMREMHQRAQDELSQRVIKVVEKELHKAIMEKETEMEEIDARILRVQQCLHTVRYCASLSYYNIGKDETQGNKARDGKLSGLHPAIRRHLGETQEPPKKTAECLTTKHISQHKIVDPTTDVKGKEPYKDSQSNSQLEDCSKTPTTFIANTTATATDCSSKSNALPLPLSHCSDETSDKSQTCATKEPNRSRPPSPKHLLPLPPDKTATISQGRQQQLQNKRRLIVGNTYQYLAPVPGEEPVDSFRYKWQLYVRAPPSDPDTSTFLQSVTFVLDHSYAPHHIITIKQPPFVLSRRGWGEFKVQLTLHFMDQRNKPIRLLHPLVLSRQDDALALTGLWRLGQENWYDLWVYLPNTETNSSPDGCASVMEEDFGPSALIKELNTGVISSQVENNITVNHETAFGTGVASQNLDEEDCAKSDILNEEIDGVSTLSNSVPCVKKLIPASSPIETADEETVIKKENEESDKKKGIVNGKTCKVLVRQSDGSLKSYALPQHLYPQAMQIALDHSKQNNTNFNIISSNKLTDETKSLQGTSHQDANHVAERNKVQFKDTLKPITLKLPSHQSTSTLSSNKVDVVGVGTTSAEAIHLAEAGSSQGRLQVLPAATDTAATTTCPQHVLLHMKKEKKYAVMQKQFGRKPFKQTTSPIIRLFQVQTLSLQAPSHESANTVKHVSEIPVIGIPQASNQNHIPLSNVKRTSNGQLLTPEKLKTMGLQLLAKKNEHNVTGTLPATITTTNVTTTAATTSPGVLIQGGRVVVGTNTLKLLTSQGKMAVKQLPLLKVHNNKVLTIPVQPQMFSNKDDQVVIKSCSGQVTDIPAIINTEDNDETKLLKVKNSSSLVSAVTQVCSETDSGSQKNLTGANNREKQVDEEQASTYWEDYLSRVCEVCKSSASSEVCVSLWLKILPLVHPSQTPPSPFSFCQAKSCQQFLRWPLAKQRACEFQRAREVVWWLEECRVEGWERWTVPRVVAWARGHAHTPVAYRPALRTDKLQVPPSSSASGKSLSYVGDLEELEQQRHQSNTACMSDSPEVDVVDLEEEESQGGSKRIPGSPLKRQLEYLQWEDAEMVSACEWVGHLSSQLRISLYPEEVAEGYMADAARGILWKATLSFMEDLLRAAYFQGWNEATDVPPSNISVRHVQAALTTARAEFDLLTEHGLGTPSEEL